MFFNVHEKNREGLVHFGDVMNLVCDDVLNNQVATLLYEQLLFIPMCVITNHIHYVTNLNPAFLIFLMCVEKHGEAWVRG